jgi:hypothetical protein
MRPSPFEFVGRDGRERIVGNLGSRCAAGRIPAASLLSSRGRGHCQAMTSEGVHQLRMIGGRPAAASMTSAASRKYAGPIIAGVMTANCFTSSLPRLSTGSRFSHSFSG